LIRLTQKDELEPYLSDASQLHGQAEGIALPENEKEIAEFLKEANAKKIPVTVSGGKTGLTGAAVPQGGWVLSLEKLSKTLEIKENPPAQESWARFEPGISLKALEETFQTKRVFYPPDPTGKKAFLGGTLATNASGPNSFKYGQTRRYVRRIRVVLASGEILELKRGEANSPGAGKIEIPLRQGRLTVPVPRYKLPSVKHAAGFFTAPGMDAIDLFIGSEGTLGVVTEIEVSLLPKPSQVIAFVAFFKSEEDSWRFAAGIREASRWNRTRAEEGIEARILEYFDRGSLEFLRPRFPAIPNEARALLFIEQEIWSGKASELRDQWYRLFSARGGSATGGEKGKALSEVWYGETPEKVKEFREFRQKLPLVVREFLAEQKQMKVGTDSCVPDERFEELMLHHRRRVEESGLLNVTFGHIGESHVHLNLLPKNAGEFEKARRLYPELLEKAMSLGGTFSAEHGAGKLKRAYLERLVGKEGIQEMVQIKRLFDPNLILGRGNIFEIE
jgi:D-lactate dehydrogenase (cytochrome)